MTYLLDTHSFLWSAFAPRNLSAKARSVILDTENEVFVSTVSLWEISLKYALGKIELEGTTPDQLPEAARMMGFDLLSLHADDAATFHRLPRTPHKDPFDRMLAWQAMRGHMTLISKDPGLAVYTRQGLVTLW